MRIQTPRIEYTAASVSAFLISGSPSSKFHPNSHTIRRTAFMNTKRKLLSDWKCFSVCWLQNLYPESMWILYLCKNTIKIIHKTYAQRIHVHSNEPHHSNLSNAQQQCPTFISEMPHSRKKLPLSIAESDLRIEEKDSWKGIFAKSIEIWVQRVINTSRDDDINMIFICDEKHCCLEQFVENAFGEIGRNVNSFKIAWILVMNTFSVQPTRYLHHEDAIVLFI